MALAPAASNQTHRVLLDRNCVTSLASHPTLNAQYLNLSRSCALLLLLLVSTAPPEAAAAMAEVMLYSRHLSSHVATLIAVFVCERVSGCVRLDARAQ